MIQIRDISLKIVKEICYLKGMPSIFLMYNLTEKQISNQVKDIVLIQSNAVIYNLLSMVWTKK